RATTRVEFGIACSEARVTRCSQSCTGPSDRASTSEVNPMLSLSIKSGVRSRVSVASALALAFAAAVAAPTAARANSDEIHFELPRSAAIVKAGCLAEARGTVTVESAGPVEHMRVKVEGLPPNTDFDFFVIQQPNTPFGMAWYQGDIETNSKG